MINYDYNETVKKLGETDASILYDNPELCELYSDVIKAYADAAGRRWLDEGDYCMAVFNGILIAKMYFDKKAKEQADKLAVIA